MNEKQIEALRVWSAIATAYLLDLLEDSGRTANADQIHDALESKEDLEF